MIPYKRKRIPGLPADATRALDAEFSALERVTNVEAPATTGGVPTTRQIISGTGLTGGGDLSADRTLSVLYGTTATTACRGDDIRLTAAGGTDLGVTGITATGLTVTSSSGADVALPAATVSAAGLATAAQITALGAAVPNTRTVSTTNGLLGGGALSGNLSLSPNYGSTAGTVCQGNDPRLGASTSTSAYLYAENSTEQGTIATSTTAGVLSKWEQLNSISSNVNSGIAFDIARGVLYVQTTGIYLLNVGFGFRATSSALLRYILFGVALNIDFNTFVRLEPIMLPANEESTRFSGGVLMKLDTGTDYAFVIGKAVSLNGDTVTNVGVAGIKYVGPSMSICRVG